MSHNILLTSMSAGENERFLRYYSAQNAYGHEYCEAMQSMEASTKYMLAHFPVDEIIVIGAKMSNAGADSGEPLRLKDARALYAEDQGKLTSFELYCSRLAQFIDELSLEQEACEKLLPEEERARIIDFIKSFQEQYSQQETKRLNRFFDELACSRKLYEQFKDAFFNTFPEARKDSRLYKKWVKNFVYTQLKLSAKLEILPVNENVCVRYIPDNKMGKREYWVRDIFDIDQDVLDGKNEINIFVSLDNDSAVDSQLLLNLLDIIVSTPGSNVHLKKIYKVFEASGKLTGSIIDSTAVSRSTDLVVAAHAFLNYSKTDMLVEFWENCGERNERISSLVYAARRVDMGISMCNIQEVQEGIQRLRKLLNDGIAWEDTGDYGLLFSVIAGSIQADYGTLLEGSGDIPFIELIKWAYRHQLYQQVLTLIESHAPVNLVTSGIFYYCDDEDRVDEITKLFARQRLELKSYEQYKLDKIEHYFIKYYDRSLVRLSGSKGEDRNRVYAAARAQSIMNPDPARISGHTACSNIELVQNVLYAYFHLGDVRNKISHADANAMIEQRLIVSENDVSSAVLLMQESIEYFIMSYEKALEDVRGKDPRVVRISPDAVRNLADRMKRERFQAERD